MHELSIDGLKMQTTTIGGLKKCKPHVSISISTNMYMAHGIKFNIFQWTVSIWAKLFQLVQLTFSCSRDWTETLFQMERE